MIPKGHAHPVVVDIAQLISCYCLGGEEPTLASAVSINHSQSARSVYRVDNTVAELSRLLNSVLWIIIHVLKNK